MAFWSSSSSSASSSEPETHCPSTPSRSASPLGSSSPTPEASSPEPSIKGSPLPQKPSQRHSDAVRLQALCIYSYTKSHNAATNFTKVSKSQLYKLRKKAESRGWNIGELVKLEHVIDEKI